MSTSVSDSPAGREGTTLTRDELLQGLRPHPWWFHSIDLGQGVVTNGWKSPELLTRELATLRLPDLRGKSVLDIGAWDGFFSFSAERLGAARVVALDYLGWLEDIGATPEYERACREQGIVGQPFADPRHLVWKRRDGELPGKRRFDLAHRALGSRVESRFADFTAVDLSSVGVFDVVLFLGVLYHMESPLDSLRRVAAVTRELAVIETEAIAVPGVEHLALSEFFESDELNADASNWWAPNARALAAMCRAAGFVRVELVAGPPPAAAPPATFLHRLGEAWDHLADGGRFTRMLPRRRRPSPAAAAVTRYRAVVHAWK